MSDDWRPTASLGALKSRAAMLAAAREFFAERGVLEVETPVLSAAAVSRTSPLAPRSRSRFLAVALIRIGRG